MDDEIINDDNGGLEKEFDRLKAEGKVKACPNLSHLPDDEKRQIMKEVSHQAAEMMMRTYIALGVMGETIVGLEDGFTKCSYEMVFKGRRKE